MGERITYLVIGNGIAGISAAETLRAEKPDAVIGIIADDPLPVYYRPALKDYLGGKIREERLLARPKSFYKDQNILFLHERAVDIEPQQHIVHLQSGQRFAYQHLLLAHGARAAQLSCPGVHLRGVTTLRTLADYQGVLERLNSVRRVVVSGSGTLALETVETLRSRGCQVTHLLRRHTLWSEVLDPIASDLVLQEERRDGVELLQEEEIAEITGTQGEVSGVLTNKGRRISCQMVLAAIGIEPNVTWLQKSGITCSRGILVDNAMRTSVPDIYAAGDVVETRDSMTNRLRVVGQWYPAVQQGRTAAYSMLNMLGSEQAFSASTFYNATFLYGLDFASVGLTAATADTDYQEVIAEPKPRNYRKVLLKDNIPVGMLSLGDRRQALAFKRAIDARVSLEPIVSRLFAEDFSLHNWLDRQGVPPLQMGVKRVEKAGKLTRAEIATTAHTLAAQREESLEKEGMMVKSQPLATEALLVQMITPGLRLRLPETTLSQKDVTVIGRQVGVQLLADEPSVSRRHAEIRYVNGEYLLRDLNSSNGTFVNEERVEPATPVSLKPHDQLRFGDFVKLQFLVRQFPPTTTPTDIPLERTVPLTTDPYLQNVRRKEISAEQTMLNGDGALLPPGVSRPVTASTITNSLPKAPALVILYQQETQELVKPPQVYLLQSGQRTTLGREKGNTILLKDPIVSRRHAEIMAGPGGLFLRDLGSSNGVLVNKKKIGDAHLLSHGDRIQMGNTTLFFVDLQTENQRTDNLQPLSEQTRSSSNENELITQTRTTELPTKQVVRVQSGGQKVEMVRCPRCGVVNTRVARFCAACSELLVDAIH